MKFEEIFYSVSWISAVSIIWFYTDAFLYYSRFLRIWIDLRLEYLSYITMHPNKFFPDFLSEKFSCSKNSFISFFSKMGSCPACSTVWLSIIAGIHYGELIIVAPIYIISLFVIYQIRNLI